ERLRVLKSVSKGQSKRRGESRIFLALRAPYDRFLGMPDLANLTGKALDQLTGDASRVSELRLLGRPCVGPRAYRDLRRFRGQTAKGAAMNRFALTIAAAVGLCLPSGPARAWFGSLGYSGYQPCWNPFRCCYSKCKTPEEKRLEHFWHDYYDALAHYY